MEVKDVNLDRATVVNQNFLQRVKSNDYPQARAKITLTEAEISKELALEIFTSQIESRQLDIVSRILRKKNHGHYTIGSSGHEGNAAIAAAVTVKDIAFLHYRSCAFMLQRARMHCGNSRAYDHLLSLVASKLDPIASGRHKVFGSLDLNVPPQTSTIASHIPKAVGTAYSIAVARDLKIKPKLDFNAVVLCSFGDASFNHSTAQGAFNSAQWVNDHCLPMPIVFVCEDNGIGVSVITKDNWIEDNVKNRINLQYIQCDGLNFCDVYAKAREAVTIARRDKKPVFLHMKTVRLLGHAGSDIEFHYRSEAQIVAIEADDPLLHSARIMIQERILTADQIINLYLQTQQIIEELAEKAAMQPKLENVAQVMQSIIPGKRLPALAKLEVQEPTLVELANKNMAQAINASLANILSKYPNSLVFGEDVGRKGGVYRVTADLQKKFGPRRVFDSMLDEQTILGTAIGFAHNGILPIPEIQYLAYVHNAIDQIRGEAATMSFFSNGQFTNPMVIRIPGLAYQKGFGGHFHNENTFAALRDIPGIIIACPSTSVDAYQLLQECVRLAQEEQRVVIFLEPIALYFTKDVNLQVDSGSDYLIISYGNGAYLSRHAISSVTKQRGTLLDLQWLAPLNEQLILDMVAKFNKVLVVDECRKTASLSEQILTLLYENNLLTSDRKVKRLAASDSFITLGESWQYLVPSIESIVKEIEGL